MTESAVFGPVHAQREHAVGTLSLNDPRRLNPLGLAMLEGVVSAAAWFDAQPDVKVVVVQGAGRAFSAGADISTFAEEMTAREARVAADTGRRMADALERMQSVTVARIHGHCVGGGLVLAAACDLRVASVDTHFVIPEVDIGIPLVWGGIPRLIREIGPARTKELVMTCRPFGAEEAHAAGFLNQVVRADELDAAVAALAATLAAKPAFALLATKQHVNSVTNQMVGVAASWSDADRFVTAMSDAETRRTAEAYVNGLRGL